MPFYGKNSHLPLFNEEGLMICRKCGNYKDILDFWKDKKNKKRHGRMSHCISCCGERERVYKKIQESKNLQLSLYYIYYNAKNRATNKKSKRICRKYPFEISIEYLYFLYTEQKGKGAISGVEMTYWKGKGRQPRNVSLDRIDSTKGYTKDNVRLVCTCINIMKSNLTDEEFYFYCREILENKEKRL